MENLSASLALCEGNPPVTGELLHKESVLLVLMADLWRFPEQIVEHTFKWLVLWDAVTLMWRHCNVWTMRDTKMRHECFSLMVASDLMPSSVIYYSAISVYKHGKHTVAQHCCRLSEQYSDETLIKEDVMAYERYVLWQHRLKHGNDIEYRLRRT